MLRPGRNWQKRWAWVKKPHRENLETNAAANTASINFLARSCLLVSYENGNLSSLQNISPVALHGEQSNKARKDKCWEKT